MQSKDVDLVQCVVGVDEDPYPDCHVTCVPMSVESIGNLPEVPPLGTSASKPLFKLSGSQNKTRQECGKGTHCREEASGDRELTGRVSSEDVG